jgi:hypothetical protein
MPKNRNTAVDGEEQNLATEAASDEIVAEEPKEKVGDKPTVVDSKEKKPRLSMPRGVQLFKLRDGVDANKYSGQRGHVIRGLQKLATANGTDKYFTIDEIDANTEGLVTRVDHKASVTWHLKGLVATQQADVKIQDEPAKAEAVAA